MQSNLIIPLRSLTGYLHIEAETKWRFVPKCQIYNIPALAPTRRQAIIWTNDC